MIPTAVLLAFAAGFSIPVFRLALARRPFRANGLWGALILPCLLGAALWLVLLIMIPIPVAQQAGAGWDRLCGALILLCACWCNYWLGNLAGGFRVLMQLDLARQPRPVTLEEWMAAYGGGGMEAFLNDRLRSVLVPLHIVAVEGEWVRLLPGWGTFFGGLMRLVNRVFPGLRRPPA